MTESTIMSLFSRIPVKHGPDQPFLATPGVNLYRGKRKTKVGVWQESKSKCFFKGSAPFGSNLVTPV
jgi:hypothetical protein